jgi:hypothetical protein
MTDEVVTRPDDRTAASDWMIDETPPRINERKPAPRLYYDVVVPHTTRGGRGHVGRLTRASTLPRKRGSCAK